MTKKKTKIKKKKEVKKKTSKPKPEDVKISAPPTAGRKMIDFEQKLDEQISGGAPQQKRGPGRPPKDIEPEPDITTIDNRIIKEAVQVPFDLWARSQRLDGLRITDQEAENLAAPIKTLLDYYLPEVPAIAYAWGSLVITVYTVTSPRFFMIEQERQKRAAKSEGLRKADHTAGNQNQGQGGPDGPPDKFPDRSDIKPVAIKH